MSSTRAGLIDQAVVQIETLFAHRRRAFCAHPMQRHVSMPQVFILISLQERGAMTISELAHLLNVSAPSASSILDRMEEHGLVERSRDQEDRRVVHVRIVETGRRLIEELMGFKRDQVQRLMDGLTDEELDHVIHGAVALERALLRLPAADEPVPLPA